MEKEQLETRLKELNELFSEYNSNIANLANDYNTKIQSIKETYNKQISELYDEAQGKIKVQEEKREQTRGAYEEIYYMLHPEQRKSNEQDTTTTEIEQEKPTEENAVQVNTVSIETETKSDEPVITNEDVANLVNQTKSNTADIPDYLKGE